MRQVYGVLAAVCFLLVLGTAGALEHGSVLFWQGVGLSLVFMAGAVLFARLAGAFD